MILPSQEIESLSNPSDNLITPFKNENLRGSSYDLTVGDEYYIGQSEDVLSLETQPLKKDQTFTIPPHAVCFILTAEKINLPQDITAKVSLRMTHIYDGMVLTSQPPFDPGYSGKVIVMLHNLSSTPVHLKSGERVATIEFSKLLNAPLQLKTHRSVNSLSEQLKKPLVSSLSDIAKSSKAAQEKVIWLSSQMLTFIGLIVAVLAIPGFFSYNGLVDRLGEQKEKLEKLNTTVEEYKNELQKNKEEFEKLKSLIVSKTPKTANIQPANANSR